MEELKLYLTRKADQKIEPECFLMLVRTESLLPAMLNNNIARGNG